MSIRFIVAVIPFFLVLPSPVAFAQEDSGYGLFNGFNEGRWRVEVGAATGFHSGNRSRTNDILATGTVEYEWPIYQRCTLGLRAYPLFLYEQDEPKESIWGGGFGGVGRVYQNADVRNGWFGEGGAAVVWHSNHIEGNSATMDFLLEAGVGYKFKNDWHVALQVLHVSNSGLSNTNAGANSVGFAVGFTF